MLYLDLLILALAWHGMLLISLEGELKYQIVLSDSPLPLYKICSKLFKLSLYCIWFSSYKHLKFMKKGEGRKLFKLRPWEHGSE